MIDLINAHTITCYKKTPSRLRRIVHGKLRDCQRKRRFKAPRSYIIHHSHRTKERRLK